MEEEIKAFITTEICPECKTEMFYNGYDGLYGHRAYCPICRKNVGVVEAFPKIVYRTKDGKKVQIQGEFKLNEYDTK